MKESSEWFLFHEEMRGYQLYNRETLEDIAKWEIFSRHNWLQISTILKSNKHPRIGCKLKHNVSKKLANNFINNNAEQENNF